jgi:hypothetical protein
LIRISSGILPRCTMRSAETRSTVSASRSSGFHPVSAARRSPISTGSS